MSQWVNQRWCLMHQCGVQGVQNFLLTHKQLEIHGCVISSVATDGLVLKHQAISSHTIDKIVIVLDQFQPNYYFRCGKH